MEEQNNIIEPITGKNSSGNNQDTAGTPKLMDSARPLINQQEDYLLKNDTQRESSATKNIQAEVDDKEDGEEVPVPSRTQLDRQQTKSNVPEELRRGESQIKRSMTKDSMRKQLIAADSFVDDFSIKNIKQSIRETYRESAKIKAEALTKASSKKKRDEKITKDAKKLLWGFASEQWCLLLLGLPFMFLGSLINFLVPNYIGRIINAFKDEDFEWDGGVKSLIFEWILATIFSAACSGFREIIFGLASERVGLSIRQTLFRTVIRKDVNFYDNFRTGDMLSRLGSDTQVVQSGLTTSVMQLIKALCIVVGTLVILMTYNVYIALILIAVLTPQVLVTRISSAYLRAFGTTYQKAKSSMSNTATESLSNIRTVKAFGDEEMVTLKYNLASQKVFEYARAKGYFWALFWVAYKFLGAGGDLALIYIIAHNMKKFDLTIGEVTAIMLYIKNIISNVSTITGSIQSVAKVHGSAYEIAVLIVTPNQIDFDGDKRPQPQTQSELDSPVDEEPQMKVEGVTFCYPSKKDVPVLKGVNINVQRNKIVALVGHSGSGKSSIISLIERFYDPVEGRLLFQGEDLRKLDNKWYHQEQLAFVQQEPVLFSCSIRDNICYGVDFGDATEEQIQERIREACRQANALTFIEDKELFPEGFDSKVGERGVRLSGGQKQRVAIARALVRKPKVILLDEATSALDAESEYQVQSAIDTLMEAGGQTCIVIAHRLSTIRNADKIVVLSKGEVIEEGSHDELIAKDGAYKKLVQRQLMKEKAGLEIKEKKAAKGKK